MDVIVTDRESIQRGVRIRASYAVISIRDPDADKVKLPKPTALRAALHLAFHDAEPAANFRLPANIKVMSRRQALQIWRFVSQHRNDVDAFVVHCHQGMSRSPAVAAAIARFLGIDDRRFWKEYSPNPYIFRLMQETAPSKTSS